MTIVIIDDKSWTSLWQRFAEEGIPVFDSKVCEILCACLSKKLQVLRLTYRSMFPTSDLGCARDMSPLCKPPRRACHCGLSKLEAVRSMRTTIVLLKMWHPGGFPLLLNMTNLNQQQPPSLPWGWQTKPLAHSFSYEFCLQGFTSITSISPLIPRSISGRWTAQDVDYHHYSFLHKKYQELKQNKARIKMFSVFHMPI